MGKYRWGLTSFGQLEGPGTYKTYFDPTMVLSLTIPWWFVCYVLTCASSHNYTPSIYAEGYVVLVFLFVCSFVRDSVNFMELLQSFTLKQIKWAISHQPLRKHSYLDHRYPGGSAVIPWLLSPGSMPQGGARSQNLGQFKKCFYFLETTYAVSWSVMAHPCDMDMWVMKWRSASSDFALYLEDYFMSVHHTLGLWISMSQSLTSKQM